MSLSIVPFSGTGRANARSGFLGGLLLLGVLGAGAGVGLAFFVADAIKEQTLGQIRQQRDISPSLPFPTSTKLQPLKPLVTNLAAPKEAWIRLQASLLLDGDSVADATVLRKRVEDDFLSYLRTLNLAHLEGGVGLQHLREDLTERAKTRTKGLVSEVILESVVIQ